MDDDTKAEALESYTLQLPVTLKRQLEDRARVEDRTMASLVRRILAEAMTNGWAQK